MSLLPVAMSSFLVIFANVIVRTADGQGGSLGFYLNGVSYPNGSTVLRNDIGEGDDALLCTTDNDRCCNCPEHEPDRPGQYYFPNGTQVPGQGPSGSHIGYFRTRGYHILRLDRLTYGNITGQFRCEIPDASWTNVSLYINIVENVYISLNGKNYTNNSDISINEIGETPSNQLQCITGWRPCCKSDSTGHWYYPNTKVILPSESGSDIYRSGGDDGTVNLNRRNNAMGPIGLFCCVIPAFTGVNRTLCVNVIPDALRFYLNGVSYPSRSTVLRTDIGERENALLCTTDNTTCCNKPSLDNRIAYYFPDNTRVSFGKSIDFCNHTDYYTTKGHQFIRLNRKSTGAITGEFRCEIPDGSGAMRTLTIHIVESVYISLNGRNYTNNSDISINDIGETSPNQLQCITDKRPCCMTHSIGHWYYPNNTIIPPAWSGADIYTNRGNDGTVNLNRRNNATMPTGLFCCVLPGSSDVYQRVCTNFISTAPATISISITSSGSNTVGEIYRLMCNAAATRTTEQPTFTWSGPGVTAGMTTTTSNMSLSTLTFSPLAASYAGIYTCMVKVGNVTLMDSTAVLIGGGSSHGVLEGVIVIVVVVVLIMAVIIILVVVVIIMRTKKKHQGGGYTLLDQDMNSDN